MGNWTVNSYTMKNNLNTIYQTILLSVIFFIKYNLFYHLIIFFFDCNQKETRMLNLTHLFDCIELIRKATIYFLFYSVIVMLILLKTKKYFSKPSIKSFIFILIVLIIYLVFNF